MNLNNKLNANTIGFISLGCEKNRVDSENMLGYLRQAGYILTNDIKQAEIIIINTCGFISIAKEESIASILESAQYKTVGACNLLLVVGCLAQRYGDELLNEIPEIDGVMGTGTVAEIVTLIEKIKNTEKTKSKQQLNLVGALGFGGIKHATSPRVLTTPGYMAYLKIAEGCDNRCSYCAIPIIRGPYSSRPLADIVQEAELLCAQGVKELIIVAQETTRYGKDIYKRYALTELLARLTEVNGLHWLRLLYCYPDAFTDELITLMASSSKICSYIDLPLQHINNRLLQQMNRRGSKEEIVQLITKLRLAIPDLTLRTTFIVGFPGESEAEFNELLSFMEESKFERAGVFGYSLEEGTPAASLSGHLSDEVIKERVNKAMLLQQRISLNHNQNKIGRSLVVLASGWDGEAMMYWGRSAADAPEIDGKVFFTSEYVVQEGDLLTVKILSASEYDLSGVQIK